MCIVPDPKIMLNSLLDCKWMSRLLVSYPMIFGVGWVEGSKYSVIKSSYYCLSKRHVRFHFHPLLKFLISKWRGVIGGIFLVWLTLILISWLPWSPLLWRIRFGIRAEYGRFSLLEKGFFSAWTSMYDRSRIELCSGLGWGCYFQITALRIQFQVFGVLLRLTGGTLWCSC